MTEKCLEIGILALLIYLPLDFGGVTPRALLILELGSAGLCLLWLFAAFRPSRHGKDSAPQQQERGRLSSAFPIVLLLFLSLVFLQFIPLPAFLVKFLSPATYDLYAEGASITQSAFPRFLPLSVCSQATENEFMKLAAYGMLFFLFLKTVRTRRRRKRFLYIIFFVGFTEAFYGLIQFVSGNHTVYTHQASAWVHGTFINKNHFAGYMEMSILLVFGLLWGRFDAASHDGRTLPEEKYIKSFFFGFVLVLMLSAHLLSGSRGGFLSLSVGMFCFLLLIFRRGFSGKTFLIVLCLFTFTLGTMSLFQAEKILPRLESLNQGERDISFSVRQLLWKDAIRIFQDYPLIGSGTGTFSHLFHRYRSFRSSLRYDYAENDYLQLLSENGILGAGLLLSAGLLFFVLTFKTWKRQHSRWRLSVISGGFCAMLSLLLHALVDFPFHIPANALLFVVIAAICFSTVKKQRGDLCCSVRRVPPTGALLAGLLLICYSVNAVRTYSASRHFRIASEWLSVFEDSETSLDPARRESIMTHLQTAIRRDSNHAGYSAALGNFLVEHPDPAGGSGGSPPEEDTFSAAEASLKRAVMLDPANPWHYYALGNLSYRRGDYETGNWQDCPVTRFFSSAFKHAPKNIFFRKTLGAWYYYFDREFAYSFLEKIFEDDRRNSGAVKESSRVFAEFLYDVQLDYESDREAKFLEQQRSGMCELKILATESADRQAPELGRDDGSAEWKTALRLEGERVKKEICLPENLAEYQSAAIKILMNRVGKASLNLRLSLDDSQIAVSEELFSQLPEWREIPVDLSLLQGKSVVNVYLRADPSSPDSFLEIWGDQETPRSQSTFNFRQTKDLSPDKGRQGGEYMIRLILRK